MNVCPNCFDDIEIQSFISSNSSSQNKCNFCNSLNVPVLGLGDFLDFFGDFFNMFVTDESGEPLTYIINRDWKIFSNYEKSESNQKIITHILKSIDSDIPNYACKVIYRSQIRESLSYWDKLKEKIKWESRFLANLEEIRSLKWDLFFQRDRIEISNLEVFYRARIHQNGQKDSYDFKEMGCPDKSKVLSGRANPQGIAYLYLSKSLDTTLYETRASYLDEISVGKFKIKDNLFLIDFTAIPSAFAFTSDDFGDINDFATSTLLKKQISKELSKPLRRYDSEIEYVPTQFICEYIRHITGADGILFESSLHQGGKNIVLFTQDKVECFSVDVVRVNKLLIESESVEKKIYIK